MLADRRFTDTGTNRVVNAAPSVRIQEPAKTNGVNAAEVSEALTNGKGKKKAYRRSVLVADIDIAILINKYWMYCQRIIAL